MFDVYYPEQAEGQETVTHNCQVVFNQNFEAEFCTSKQEVDLLLAELKWDEFTGTVWLFQYGSRYFSKTSETCLKIDNRGLE